MVIDLTNLKAITNKKFMPEYDCFDRYLIFNGGGNSGKSHFFATKIIVRCLYAQANRYRHKFLITRKTQPAVRKSAFELIKTKIALFNLPASAVKINKTMLEMHIYDQQILFCGLDDPEKIKSIEGITTIWEEEATELKADDHTQLDLRLRGFKDDYMQMMLSFNPIDEQNWINHEFFKNREGVEDVTPSQWPNYKRRIRFIAKVEGRMVYNYATCVHSTVDDNRWATDEEKAVLEALKYKDPNYYKVYRLGQWGILKGLIYEDWKELKQWPTDFEISAYGLDFGFTNHPSALVHIGISGDNLYLEEKFYEKGLTNADIADIMPEDANNTPTIADCAEPKSIAELCRAGMNVHPCKKGKDSVVHGIQKVKQFNIHVHPASINLIKEFRAYKWAVDKNGLSLNKPVDFMDHLLDAVRYAVGYLTNYMQVSLEFADDPKEVRKAEIQADGYSELEDPALWTDID